MFANIHTKVDNMPINMTFVCYECFQNVLQSLSLDFSVAKIVQKCFVACFLQPCNSYLCFVNAMRPNENAYHNPLCIYSYQSCHASVQAGEEELAVLVS